MITRFTIKKSDRTERAVFFIIKKKSTLGYRLLIGLSLMSMVRKQNPKPSLTHTHQCYLLFYEQDINVTGRMHRLDAPQVCYHLHNACVKFAGKNSRE